MKTNEFFKTLHESLFGLPHLSQLVILKAVSLSKLDYGHCIISNVTAEEIAVSLSVTRAPGRRAEIITKSKVLNAFKTIKRSCPDIFQFETVNQRIIIKLPALQKTCLTTEVATENVTEEQTGEPIENKEKTTVSLEDIATGITIEVATEDNTASQSNINNKHNSNKQTSCDEKSLISKNFYPSEKTIHEAQEQGFLKVTDPEEIKAFIEHNQDRESRWEDFNPIFLCWLEKCFSHKPKQTQQATRTTGNYKNVCNISKKSTAHEESNRRNQKIISDCEANEQKQLPNHFG